MNPRLRSLNWFFFSQPARPYYFAYDVKDDYTYNNYGQKENSDGKVTTGSYYVLLPDGRTQIVTYKADSYGYNADVQYEGYAKYPEYVAKKEYKTAPYETPVYKTPAYPTPTYTAPAAKYPEYKAPEYKVPEYKTEYPAPAAY